MEVGVEEIGMQGRNFQKDNSEVVVGKIIYSREADLGTEFILCLLRGLQLA